MSEGSPQLRMLRSVTTRYPLNEAEVPIYELPVSAGFGAEALFPVIPYVALAEAMEHPPQLTPDRLAAACAPYLRKHENSAGNICALVPLHHLSAVLDKLGDAYPLAQHRAILDQFAAAAAAEPAEEFDEDDIDGEHSRGSAAAAAASSPLVVEVDPTAPEAVQALQEELNEAAIAENLIWAALVGQRAKRRRLQKRLGIE